MKKAKREGVPFDSIFQFAANAYVRGQFYLSPAEPEIFNDKTRREMIKISQDIKEGKNLSPIFDNAQDAIAYLKSSK